jgi:hypothetical protein
MIVDLFSHKIHSSDDNWPDKLAELAAIFGEFDGELFDRAAFEDRLQRISPRASYFAQSASAPIEGNRLDVSKFRDEISAYPAYLGLYFLERSGGGWVVRVSDTAKRFLLREDPDVGSFLRLQLPLFQFPNAMGARYTSFTNRLNIQANARNRALAFIADGIHFSPVRLIAVALKADAELRSVSLAAASVTFDEIFGLANTGHIVRRTLPSAEHVARALVGIRAGRIDVPERYQSRFHILRHTEMFTLGQGTVRLRESVNDADQKQLMRQLEAIMSIRNQFDGFDRCTTGRELEDVIGSGAWGRYFDGVNVLSANVVEALTNDQALDAAAMVRPPLVAPGVPPQPVPQQIAAELSPFRERTDRLPVIRPYNRRHELADPEATRIKMQRRNLTHKELIDKMDAWLRGLGARPTENDHIDLFARIPQDGSFIFEMKSGGESILEQIRKGLSQLYEYRYRYRPTLGDDDISLCLVLPESPGAIPWIIDYLVADRDINVCWFDEDDNLAWPDPCAARLEVLLPNEPGPAYRK